MQISLDRDIRTRPPQPVGLNKATAAICYTLPQSCNLVDQRGTLALYQLPEIVLGNLGDLIDTFTREDQTDQLAGLAEAH